MLCNDQRAGTGTGARTCSTSSARTPPWEAMEHEHTRQPSTLVSVSMRLDPYEVVHALGSVQIDRNAVVIEAPSKRRVGSGRGAAVTTG